MRHNRRAMKPVEDVARRREAAEAPLKQHDACGIARTVEHRLRSLQNGDPVERRRENIGGRRIHSMRATPEGALPVEKEIEARACLSAEPGFAIGATLTYDREAAHGL